MANDRVTIWNNGLKFGRAPANGELLIGDGSTNEFGLATLTAGSNVTITNSAGGITIASTNPGGTVTNVTATAPLTSSGGTTPDIALTTPLTVQYGGTGLATLTSNYLLTGNGTGNVNLIAPGTSGNVLTSNGTAWTSQSLSLAPELIWSAAATGATVETSTIPSTYAYVVAYLAGVGHNAATGRQIYVSISSDNGSTYDTGLFYAITGNMTSANIAYMNVNFINYWSSVSGMAKHGFASGSYGVNLTTSIVYTSTTNPINKIKFYLSGTGSFDAGTFYLYGYK